MKCYKTLRKKRDTTLRVFSLEFKILMLRKELPKEIHFLIFVNFITKKYIRSEKERFKITKHIVSYVFEIEIIKLSFKSFDLIKIEID